ncbi:MAG TPA: 50S ribosomal protein L4 [Candidatus Methylomirabilis sp.]|nr:50S ribosomal protein L4 [Candidatus Methylomirabilis sp.]
MTTTLDVVNAKNEKVDSLELPAAIFAAPVKGHILHEVVRMQLANRRQGTADTKGRSDVSGGGKKPWKQKGTGRARSGTTRSPLWRHGGTTFGPHPRSYAYEVPKAVRRQALLAALTSKAQAGAIRLLESISLEKPSTKQMQGMLLAVGAQGKALVVLPARDEVVEKSARNLPEVRVLTVRGLNVYDILNANTLVLTPEGVHTLREVLAP